MANRACRRVNLKRKVEDMNKEMMEERNLEIAKKALDDFIKKMI